MEKKAKGSSGSRRSRGATGLRVEGDPVAMECKECGVPVILFRNTGQADLIDDNYFSLDQGWRTYHTWPGDDLPGWGESEAEEVVERLEQVFRIVPRSNAAAWAVPRRLPGAPEQLTRDR